MTAIHSDRLIDPRALRARFDHLLAEHGGSSAKLRPGDNTSAITEKIYDDGYTFMLVEIDGDDLHFQTVNDKGVTVDYGIIRKGVNNAVTGTSTATGTTGTGTPGAAPAATGAPAGRGAPAPAGRGR